MPCQWLGIGWQVALSLATGCRGTLGLGEESRQAGARILDRRNFPERAPKAGALFFCGQLRLTHLPRPVGFVSTALLIFRISTSGFHIVRRARPAFRLRLPDDTVNIMGSSKRPHAPVLAFRAHEFSRRTTEETVSFDCPRWPQRETRNGSTSGVPVHVS